MVKCFIVISDKKWLNAPVLKNMIVLILLYLNKGAISMLAKSSTIGVWNGVVEICNGIPK